MTSAGRGYPLAALVELRRRVVDEARAELAAAAAEAVRSGRRAAEAEQSHRAAVERRRAAARELAWADAADAPARGRWLERLGQGERAARAEADRLREEADRCALREDRRRALWIDAERQLRTVERHRELWEAERRRAVRAADEREQEELALARPRAGSVFRRA